MGSNKIKNNSERANKSDSKVLIQSCSLRSGALNHGKHWVVQNSAEIREEYTVNPKDTMLGSVDDDGEEGAGSESDMTR